MIYFFLVQSASWLIGKMKIFFDWVSCILFLSFDHGKTLAVVQRTACVQICFGVTSATGTAQFYHNLATSKANCRAVPFPRAEQRKAHAGVELAILRLRVSAYHSEISWRPTNFTIFVKLVAGLKNYLRELYFLHSCCSGRILQ